MKLVLTLALSLLPIAAQTTVNPPAVTLNDEAVAAVQTWMLTQQAGSVTLSNPADNATTALRVSDGTGLNGKVLFLGTEAVLVTARSGRDLTVTRGVLGTTPAAHSANATVAVLKFADIRSLTQQIVLDKLREIVNISPTATILTKRQAQQVLESEIEAAKAAAVQ